MTIQKQIIQLLKWVNQKRGTAIMFISHNLGVVQELCDRVVVMYKGKIMEEGSIGDVFRSPKDDYTKRLLDAIPTRNHSLRRRR